MRLDMSHALRHDERLPNPSALHGARWGAASVAPSPSVPLPQGEREAKPPLPLWERAGERGKIAPTLKIFNDKCNSK